MKDFGSKIRALREAEKLPLRKVAAFLDIDQAILSKIERGLRTARREHVLQLAKFFKTDERDLMLAWLSDRVIDEIGDGELAIESLHLAEEKIAYEAFGKTDRDSLINSVNNYFKQDERVKRAWIFGSFARGDDTPESDIDLMIEVPEEMRFTLFDFAEIRFDLEDLLKRKIDLVERGAIKPFAWEKAQDEIKLIYEQK